MIEETRFILKFPNLRDGGGLRAHMAPTLEMTNKGATPKDVRGEKPKARKGSKIERTFDEDGVLGENMSQWEELTFVLALGLPRPFEDWKIDAEETFHRGPCSTFFSHRI